MEDKPYKRRSSLSSLMIISDELHEESQNDHSTDSGPPDSPPYRDAKVASTSTSSPKRSGKRGAHKRVVSIPIKDVEGFRLKGENAPPPADSWAWRKYGQKPIKGSPYPRGYYRCSSSKGCPARKQVERSRVDPTMLVITYSSDHNHPWPPPSRIHHHHHHSKPAAATSSSSPSPPTHPDTPEPEPEPEPEPATSERFTSFGNEDPILRAEEFGWFGEMETTSSASSTIMDCPIFAGKGAGNSDVGMSDMFLPMREEDELLFADLGELPECTAVFRHHRRGLGTEVEIC